MSANKRMHKRLPIRGFMKCTAKFDRKGSLFAEIPVLSLSAGGMFMACEHRRLNTLDQDDKLEKICFDLDELQGVEVQGKIVHCMSLGEIAGCGVEFFDLSLDHRLVLDHFVETKLKEFGLWDFC